MFDFEFLELSEEKQSLVGFFGDVVCVGLPFACVTDECAKKFERVCYGYGFSRDVDGGFGFVMFCW